jgi:hypothetical protein
MHARTVLSGIVYAFPEARPCHSRVAEELEGYGGEQLELRGGHFVPTGEGNDIIKNSGEVLLGLTPAALRKPREQRRSNFAQTGSKEHAGKRLPVVIR